MGSRRPRCARPAATIHAGWTQAMLVRADGQLLHITSSSIASAPARAESNEILHATAPLALGRYEAENAARRRAAQIDDAGASAGRKVRLASGAGADLVFEVRAGRAGDRHIRLRLRRHRLRRRAARAGEWPGAALPRFRRPARPAPAGARRRSSHPWRKATTASSSATATGRWTTTIWTSPPRRWRHDFPRFPCHAPSRAIPLLSDNQSGRRTRRTEPKGLQ